MELARRPHAPPSVLDTQMAHDLGFSRHAIAHRVERGHWKRLVRGVYLTHSGVPTRDEWIRAALLWGGPDAVLAGLPALRLHGLRFDFSDTPIVYWSRAARPAYRLEGSLSGTPPGYPSRAWCPGIRSHRRREPWSKRAY